MALLKTCGMMCSAHILRPCHLKPVQVRTVVKNVYEMVDYKSSFSDQQRDIILKTINESDSADQLVEKGVAKSQSAKIWSHLNQHGPFQKIEQLLDVKRFNVSTVENLELAPREMESSQSQEDLSELIEAKTNDNLAKQVRPPLKIALKELHTPKSILALKYNLKHLSFIHMSSSSPSSILAWDCIPIFTGNFGNANFEPFRIYETCQEVFSTLPIDDNMVFVTENEVRITDKDPYIQLKVRTLQIQASLMALLNQGGPNRVFNLRSMVTNSMYNLKMGNDRVLVGDLVRNMVQDNRSEIDPLALRNFANVTNLKQREQMAMTFLVGEAFLKILRHVSE
ncbi:hypothetical protein TCAL_15736 [Tigriopus californicus]|uniref:Uncharacterized protein n=1 Tax=Tigriopus californicus TaxID=6832 RepID=A0A553P6U7_TIGCA|nr:hypothetical protein TCAL_15736 [Tigriopus californicus]